MRTGECNRCGKCCQYIKLPLARTLNEDERRWAELHKGVSVEGRYVRLETPCVAYAGGCSIYDKRPQMCRDYPQSPLDEGCSYQFEKEFSWQAR